MSVFVTFPARGFIALSGEQVTEFLQGLVTQDMRLLSPQNPLLYSALLTPQGKYLFDFFIWHDEDRVLLELEPERRDELCALLKKYKLRRAITFDVFDADVFQIFSDRHPDENRDLDSVLQRNDMIMDPRHNNLGHRTRTKPDGTETTMDIWTAHRLAYNVPECYKDLRVGLSSPFEGNIDVLHGISFDKGCYMGQELVSRIHHRGLVKRRFPHLRD